MNDHTSPLPTGSPVEEMPHGDTDSASHPEPEPANAAHREPPWITGPSAPTVLAGLLTLVISALAIVRLATDVAVDWSVAVPVTVIAVGFIAVVLGAVSFTRRSQQAEHGSTE